MTDIFKVAGAFAAGYAVCRYMEAKAHDVPLDVAFKDPFKSVLLLRAAIDAATTPKKELAGISGLHVVR